MKVEFTDEARADLFDAADYYEGTDWTSKPQTVEKSRGSRDLSS